MPEASQAIAADEPADPDDDSVPDEDAGSEDSATDLGQSKVDEDSEVGQESESQKDESQKDESQKDEIQKDEDAAEGDDSGPRENRSRHLLRRDRLSAVEELRLRHQEAHEKERGGRLRVRVGQRG